MEPWRHLFVPATNTHYTNGGYIPADAEVPITGAEWVEGEAPEGSTTWVKPSLHDQLKAILMTLPPEVQAQFGEVAAAINLAIENGSPNVAVLELQALTLPSDLEPVRAQMLAVLNGIQ